MEWNTKFMELTVQKYLEGREKFKKAGVGRQLNFMGITLKI